MVKRFMRSGNFGGSLEKDFFGNPIRPFKPLPGMPIVPGLEEIEKNKRARSAKLRVAIKNE
jgi:16S rRNA (cytosine1402-N4)-methyltransferase